MTSAHAGVAMLPDRDIEASDQDFFIEWLCQKADCAVVECLLAGLFCRNGRYEQER
jgi:hypothetical protein